MGGGEQMIPPPKKSDAWKKLKKEIHKFSKLMIFCTDCSQSMGRATICDKNQWQNFKTFFATCTRIASHFNDPTQVGSLSH
jgi:hypothetical protein